MLEREFKNSLQNSIHGNFSCQLPEEVSLEEQS